MRGFFGDFFGSVAAASVDSTAANAADGVSDAAGEGGSARAGSVEADAPSVAGAGVAGFETTHIGASERPVDLDVFAAADVPDFVTAHRGGGSERAACLNSGAMIEGGVEPDGLDVTREVCDRTLPVISGAAAVVVDVRPLAVTRDAGSERTTNAVPDGWTVLPEDS